MTEYITYVWTCDECGYYFETDDKQFWNDRIIFHQNEHIKETAE
jgi:hypothetical protein